MFQEADPEVVVHMNQFLPPSGDNRSVVTLEGRLLNVDVFFDAHEGDGEDSIRLTFEDTVSVVVAAAPGIDVTNMKCEGVGLAIADVVEYRKSAIASAWRSTLPWKTRHFMLYLMEQGRLLHVFAADCQVCDGRRSPDQ